MTRTSPLQTGVPTCELCETNLMLNLCFRKSAQTTGGHLFRLSATSTIFVHTRPATEEHLELLQDVGTIIRFNVMAGRSDCKVGLPWDRHLWRLPFHLTSWPGWVGLGVCYCTLSQWGHWKWGYISVSWKRSRLWIRKNRGLQLSTTALQGFWCIKIDPRSGS